MQKLGIFKKLIIISILVFAGLFIAFFIATSLTIGESVRKNCYHGARKCWQANKNCGDCVTNLILVVDDTEDYIEDRNHAIWALGQLGDKRALEVLKKYYTGNIPEKEPYSEGISQYELKKAIELIESEFNLSAFVWRLGRSF